MSVASQRPCAGPKAVAPKFRFAPALAVLLGTLMLANCTHAPDAPTRRLAHPVKHRTVSRPAAPVAKPVATAPRPAVTDDVVSALPASTKAARPIPLPDKGLLERQGAPDCELKTEPAAPSEQEAKIKILDHERRCYREVESIVRSRLDKLQDAVGATITAIEAREKAPR